MEYDNLICDEDKKLLDIAEQTQIPLVDLIDQKYLLEQKFDKNPTKYNKSFNKYIKEYLDHYQVNGVTDYRSYFNNHAFDICYEYGLGEVCYDKSKQRLKRIESTYTYEVPKYKKKYDKLIKEFIKNHTEYYLYIDIYGNICDACGPMSGGRIMSPKDAFYNIAKDFYKEYNIPYEIETITTKYSTYV